MLLKNSLLKHVIEERIEGKGREGKKKKKKKKLLDDLKEKKILEYERGNTSSHYGEFCKWLRICRMTDYVVNE
jgi:hypothetical protein